MWSLQPDGITPETQIWPLPFPSSPLIAQPFQWSVGKYNEDLIRTTFFKEIFLKVALFGDILTTAVSRTALLGWNYCEILPRYVSALHRSIAVIWKQISIINHLSTWCGLLTSRAFPGSCWALRCAGAGVDRLVSCAQPVPKPWKRSSASSRAVCSCLTCSRARASARGSSRSS